VMVLGASSYTYAEASWTQSLPDWLASHWRANQYFGGVPAAMVPDCLKSGVKKADRYEPKENETYQEMAEHCGTVVLPARPYKPRDKAKVEVGVQVVQRWILGRLRTRTFFSLAELNAAIRVLLEDLNRRPFRKMKEHSRRSLYEMLDKPALKPLPAKPYEMVERSSAKVFLDYHIKVDKSRPLQYGSSIYQRPRERQGQLSAGPGAEGRQSSGPKNSTGRTQCLGCLFVPSQIKRLATPFGPPWVRAG